jgi:microcystin-dependent protein
MAISHWENTDKWGVLRDIINEVIDAVNLSMPPIGSLYPYTGATDPNERMMIADGRALSRTEYAEAFAVMGEYYGPGDGSTTFNLPDLRGRTVFGNDNVTDEFGLLGLKGGVKRVLLTASQSGVREHAHLAFNTGSGDVGITLAATGAAYDSYGGGVINVDGEGFRDGAQDAKDEHENLPPYQVLNWVVRVR